MSLSRGMQRFSLLNEGLDVVVVTRRRAERWFLGDEDSRTTAPAEPVSVARAWCRLSRY